MEPKLTGKEERELREDRIEGEMVRQDGTWESLRVRAHRRACSGLKWVSLMGYFRGRAISCNDRATGGGGNCSGCCQCSQLSQMVFLDLCAHPPESVCLSPQCLPTTVLRGLCWAC